MEEGQRSKLVWKEYLFSPPVEEAVAMLIQWGGRTRLIADNLCRCTGYFQIVETIKEAPHW